MWYALLAAVLFPSLLLAQAPLPGQPVPVRRIQPASEQTAADALPDNYELTLTITEKDAEPADLSVVVSSTRFSAQSGDPSLSFSGTINVDETGNITVAYALGWETAITTGANVQYKPTSIQGSVRLKAGEDVQIIRAGKRTARLSVKKLDAVKPK